MSTASLQSENEDAKPDLHSVNMFCHKCYTQMASLQCEYEDVQLNLKIEQRFCRKCHMKMASLLCGECGDAKIELKSR